MPRSVRVAVVTACVVALFGVAAVAIWAVDLFTGGAASAGLGTTFGSLVGYLALPAGTIPLAAMRRDGRLRALSFQVALLAAMLLGFVALAELVIAFVVGVSADSVIILIAFALSVVLASSLSRPSAKAWFTAPARA